MEGIIKNTIFTKITFLLFCVFLSCVLFLNINVSNLYAGNEYTLSYDSNGSTTYESITTSTVVFPENNPTKDNYYFVGWFYNDSFDLRALEGETLDANTTLYAKWRLIDPITSEGITFDYPIKSDFKEIYLTSGTYYLYEDVNYTSKFRIEEGEDVKICLNDHVLTFDNKSIDVYGTLTLYDNGNTVRYFDLNEEGYNIEGFSTTNNGEKIITKGGVILNGGIEANEQSNVIINNGNFIGGGLIICDDAFVTFNNGSIQGCYKMSGSAVKIFSDSIFTMNGGEISNNFADGCAAGVLNYNIFNMFGGKIINNTIISKDYGNANPATFGGGAGVLNFGIMNVGGDAFVQNNWNDELKQKDNVNILCDWGYVDYTYINIDENHPFTENACIGLSINSESVLDNIYWEEVTEQLYFAVNESGTTGLKHFVSDNDVFYVSTRTNSFDTTKGECISLVHRLIAQPSKDNNYKYVIDETNATPTYSWSKLVEKGTLLSKYISDIDNELYPSTGTLNSDSVTSEKVNYGNRQYHIVFYFLEDVTKITFNYTGSLTIYDSNTGLSKNGTTYTYNLIPSWGYLEIYAEESFDITDVKVYYYGSEKVTTENESKIKNPTTSNKYFCECKIGDAVLTSDYVTPVKVSFTATDALGEGVDSIYSFEGRKILLPKTGYSKTGLDLIAWTDGENNYLVGTEYTVPSSDITLEAVFGHLCNGIGFDKELDSTFTGGTIENGYYYLSSDITLEENIRFINSYKDVFICLNGHLLNLNGCEIVHDKKMQLFDCSNHDECVHNYKVTDTGLWVLTSDSATKSIEFLTQRPSIGDVIAVKGSAIVGGNGMNYGGAVYAGTLIAKNVNFIGNNVYYFSDCKGGAVYAEEATIINCNFYGNTGSEGSALAGIKLNVFNSTFKFNTTYQYENNGLKGGNGTIFSENRLRLESSTVMFNNATKGGGLYVDSKSGIATIIDSTITNNTATSEGGGFCFGEASCFPEGTLVTMADGSLRPIEEVKEGDSVKSFNHETGLYESHDVCYVYKSKYTDNYFTLTFESGATLNITGCHDLFNKETRKYVTISELNASSFVGKSFYNTTLNDGLGGYDKLVSAEISYDYKYYYSIYVEYTTNSIANGFLSCPDDTDFHLNVYEMDINLKADMDQLAQDLETFGTWPIDRLPALTQEEYDIFKLEYCFVYMGKGLISSNALHNLFYEFHDYDEFTEGVSVKTLIIGSNTTIKDNKVGDTTNNVYLNSGCKIKVLDDATNIDVGITLKDTLGVFAESVYSNKVGFFSDNTAFGVAKKNNDGKYDYSLSIIKEQPSKDNDYTAVIDDSIKDDYTYQWYQYREVKMSDLTPTTDGFVTGDYDEDSLSNYYEINLCISAKYFVDGAVIKYKGTGNFYDELGEDGYYSHPVYATNIVYFPETTIPSYFFVLIESPDEELLTITDFIIVDSKALSNETNAKLGSTTLIDATYFCNVYKDGVLADTSETLIPTKVSFNGGEGSTGSIDDMYQLDGRTITLPVNAFSKTDYSFTGWTIGSSSLNEKASYKVGSTDTTFTAGWKKFKTVSITETAQTYTYDGTSKSFELKGTDKSIGSFTISYYVNNSWTTTAPKSAGSYNVKITRSADSTYSAYSKEITNGLVINKAAYLMSGVLWYYTSALTYTGSAQSVEIYGLPNGVTVKSYTDNEKTNVGKYTAKVTFNYDTTNYLEPTFDDLDWEIKKADYQMWVASWSYTNAYTYDGQSHKVEVSGLPSGVTVKSYTDNEKTNAGDYTAKVTFNYDTANYNEPKIDDLSWTINKATITIDTTNVIKTYTYNGSEQIVNSGATVNNTESTLVYTNNKFTNVGTGKYTVTISCAETTNYLKASTTVDITVNKANYVMTSAKWNYTNAFTYDGNNHKVEVSGLPSGVTVKSYTNNEKTNAGDYTAKVTFNYDSTNYNEPKMDDLSWTINKAAYLMAGVLWYYTSALTYTGSAQTVEIYGLPSGVTVKSYTDNEKTNVGKYTAKVTFNYDTTNYLEPTFDDLDWEIKKADYQMWVASWSYTNAYTYDGQSHKVEVSGLPSGVTVKSYTDNEKTNAGDYTAKVTFNYDTANYNEPTMSDLVWTINKAQTIIDTTNVVKTYTYNESEQTINSGATVNNTESTLVYTNNKFTNVGPYTVTISCPETTNYLSASTTVDITVNKQKVSEPTVKGTYKENGTPITVSFNGLEDYMTTSSNLTETAHGIYTVEFTLDDNHEWDEDSDGLVKWEINVASLDSKSEDEKTNAIVTTDDGFDSTITVVVEVTIESELQNEQLMVDYKTLNTTDLLDDDEKVGVVFGVKLIRTIDGVKQEIQPSDIKPGTILKVKLLIPEDVDTSKITKILHVHSSNDIEEIEFDASKIDEDGYYEIEIDRLSEFAFVYKNPCIIHWFLLALLILFFIFIAVMCFCLKIDRFITEGKLNLVPVVGFVVYLLLIVILGILSSCMMCYVFVLLNIEALICAIILYK